MKMIPLFRCKDMRKAIRFYTSVLDFKLKDAGSGPDNPVVILIKEDAELMLTVLEGDQKAGIAANVIVTEIDSLFRKYIKRGLNVGGKGNSPVHQGPVDQTWGTREFYVTDEDGNTLRFVQRQP